MELEYKGLVAMIGYAPDTNTYHGEVPMPNDLLVFEAESIEGIEEEFEIAVDTFRRHFRSRLCPAPT